MTETLVANRYRLLRRLAAGGMGEVHLAAQVGPAGYERVVALKRMLPNLTADPEGLKLFLDEARLVAQLNHRNICQIVELGENDEGYFVALEFITGASVYSVLEKLRRAKERLDPYYAVDIAGQVAEALSYAYTAPGRDGQPLRIIHRDVTPHNVLLSTAGDVKLIDFGVAKSTQQQHSTESGTVKGKMGYLSPEQSRGKALDCRSDLFSLGIMLYEMVFGINPFARPDLIEMIRAIQSEELPPLGSVDPRWAPIDPVLARLLCKAPDGRFPDANSAAEALLDLRQAIPRPPQRLGPYISERFSAELADIAKSITDSQMRIHADGTLHKSTPAAPAVPPAGAMATALPEWVAPTLHRSGPVAGANPGGPAPTPSSPAVAPAPGAPVYAQTVIGLGARPAGDDITADDDTTAAPSSKRRAAADQELVDAPIPRSRTGPVVGGLVLVGAIVVGIGYFAASSAPTPAPTVPLSAVQQPPIPRLAMPTPTALVEVPVVPVTPPLAPPAVAPTPVVAVAPTPAPVPAPAITAAPVKDEPPARHDAKKKHVHESAATPAAPVAVAATPAPPAGPTIGVLKVSGGSKDLSQPSGHLDLADPNGHFKIGLDYTVSGGLVKARLSTTPWALVYVNGPSGGNTKEKPVELPPLGSSPMRVELVHPGIDTSKLVMTFEPR